MRRVAPAKLPLVPTTTAPPRRSRRAPLQALYELVVVAAGGVWRLQVLFLRGLPHDFRDFEVTPLFAGFCDSPKILVLHGKGHALVEFPTVALAGWNMQRSIHWLLAPRVALGLRMRARGARAQSAGRFFLVSKRVFFWLLGACGLWSRTDAALRHYSSGSPALVRGHCVFMSFSTHSELTLKEDGSGEHSEDAVTPSSVLHIRISRVLYPVAVDTLAQVGTRCASFPRCLYSILSRIAAFVACSCWRAMRNVIWRSRGADDRFEAGLLLSSMLSGRCSATLAASSRSSSSPRTTSAWHWRNSTPSQVPRQR